MTTSIATRTEHDETPPLVALDRLAMFLDFDGTIAEIVDHPDAVEVQPELIALIDHLARATDGALAVVTGRDIESIDRFLSPLRLPVAGVHGLVRRRLEGSVVEADIDVAALHRIGTAVAAFADRHPGTLIERKSASVALHYRRVPEFAVAARDAMMAAIGAESGFQMLEGKAVVEARSNGHDKGGAIDAFMSEPPFAGRVPVFAGDDVTDEDGFARVNAHGGLTIKIGDGATAARYRFAGIADLHGWLRLLAGATRSECTVEEGR